MQLVFLAAQIVLAIILVLLVLVQSKGTGLGRTFGSTSSFTKRGVERIVFRATFVVSGFFLAVSILQLAI